ncbi:MAG: 23S rRNA (guanosine(2251)-2'-O)-methyltransferase RlmB [Alphaproteobacteria bacterium]|nr:23S rRNA (guanosine(2251)-2'-O)-methyltransferase RlmB [Alphaproteobacteria bacterium]
MTTAPRTRRKPSRATGAQRSGDDPILLYGIHAAAAALANPARPIRKILATDNAARKLQSAITERGLNVEAARPKDLDKILPPDAVHQGVCLTVDPLPEPELAELAERAVDGGPLLVLDHVTDPHNVGAVLRSAAVFGASGLIMTHRHSPPLNGTLAKSASGALELVPIAFVQNLAKALNTLRDAGLEIVGLAGDSAMALEAEPFDQATALVLGAEGKGLRQLTQETCDRLVRISASGNLASLNVSNAAAVALHVAAQKRETQTSK